MPGLGRRPPAWREPPTSISARRTKPGSVALTAGCQNGDFSFFSNFFFLPCPIKATVAALRHGRQGGVSGPPHHTSAKCHNAFLILAVFHSAFPSFYLFPRLLSRVAQRQLGPTYLCLAPTPSPVYPVPNGCDLLSTPKCDLHLTPTISTTSQDAASPF